MCPRENTDPIPIPSEQFSGKVFHHSKFLQLYLCPAHYFQIISKI